jgi:predicted aspartyl protease
MVLSKQNVATGVLAGLHGLNVGIIVKVYLQPVMTEYKTKVKLAWIVVDHVRLVEVVEVYLQPVMTEYKTKVKLAWIVVDHVRLVEVFHHLHLHLHQVQLVPVVQLPFRTLHHVRTE